MKTNSSNKSTKSFMKNNNFKKYDFPMDIVIRKKLIPFPIKASYKNLPKDDMIIYLKEKWYSIL